MAKGFPRRTQTADAGASATSPVLADTPDLRAESPSDLRLPGTLLAGDVLGDRYRIRGLLGRGGMSTLFVADDLRTSGQVAIKVPQAPHYARRIEREAFAAARVRHHARTCCSTSAWRTSRRRAPRAGR